MNLQHEEFGKVYMRFSDKIFRFLYWHTKDPYWAEDITAEVFVRAWKNWQKFKPEYIQAWLYKIANNLLIDNWRKRKNEKKVSLEDTIEKGIEPSYDEDLIGKITRSENVLKLNKALDLLSEKLKKVAILRFIDGLSAKEVGQILGISEVNVRVLQHRALVKLKEIFKNGQIF